MKVALLQLNYWIGDIWGNAQKIEDAAKQATGADLCVCSELAILGYPPRDLLFNQHLLKQSWLALQQLAERCRNLPPLLVGFAEHSPANSVATSKLYNSVALLKNGEFKTVARKTLLPNYDIFEEALYFEPAHSRQAEEAQVFNQISINGQHISLSICEDLWQPDIWEQHNPTSLKQASWHINLSASPFWRGKQEQRIEVFKKTAKRHQLWLACVNQVGGNDEIIYDGKSFVLNPQGEVCAVGQAFEPDIVVLDDACPPKPIYPTFNEQPSIHNALLLGVKDYFVKTCFSKAVVGLSGGVDSALTATIAQHALGKTAVVGVLMPSPYSSQHSVNDAQALAENLGIQTYTLPIEKLMHAYDQNFLQALQQKPNGLAAENMQARIRGTLLMTFANQHNALLLSTGNKSELAVGYCTLYGDMCGALAVIADLYKTEVYALAKWINQQFGVLIPENTLNKAPSAELRPDQTDQDSLPSYPVLDAILKQHLEQHKNPDQIKDADPEIVQKVLKLVFQAEFKRRQAAPVLKLSPQSLGLGWRFPVAAFYRQPTSDQ